MDEFNKKLEQSKGNIEIEGLEVPDMDVIHFLVNKYKDKLGEEALDSLLYSIYKGNEIYKEEKNGLCESLDRRSIK